MLDLQASSPLALDLEAYIIRSCELWRRAASNHVDASLHLYDLAPSLVNLQALRPLRLTLRGMPKGSCVTRNLRTTKLAFTERQS